MKEKIVIERNEDTSEIVKKFPNRSGEHIDFIEIFTPHENCKLEQVPETFEELKELCKLCEQHKRFKFEETEGYDSIYLYDCANIINFSMHKYSGCIRMLCKGYCVAKDLKPKAVWQIIKNLTGEE